MIAALPNLETVDLFADLASPFAAKCLSHLLGLPEVAIADMERWSQVLIDGAGNFVWDPALFDDCDRANAEMDIVMDAAIKRHKAELNPSALCAMVTMLYGLPTNPQQLEDVKQNTRWGEALPKGETVMTIQACANHDEDIWMDPHLYDVNRDKKPHQAFGKPAPVFEENDLQITFMPSMPAANTTAAALMVPEMAASLLE